MEKTLAQKIMDLRKQLAIGTNALAAASELSLEIEKDVTKVSEMTALLGAFKAPGASVSAPTTGGKRGRKTDAERAALASATAPKV